VIEGKTRLPTTSESPVAPRPLWWTDWSGKAWLNDTPNPSDRRPTLVRLSDVGKAHVQRSHDWLAAALGKVSPDELPALTGALQRISGELRTESTRALDRE